MNAYVKNKLKRFRRLNENRSGGIEGLPMELMIIVVVATLGTAMLIGWMGNIDAEPDTIGDVDCSVGQIVLSNDSKSNVSFTITVRDGDGDAIKDATVVLSGCGVTKTGSSGSVYSTTDASGTASFTGLTITKTTAGVGYINVTVSAGDYGEDSSLKIPVVR